MTLTVDDAVADLPPASKLVYMVLDDAEGNSLLAEEIRERTALHRTTTYKACQKLLEAGLATHTYERSDGRRSRYTLADVNRNGSEA